MDNYCVYCHTNKINQKKYYGITRQKPENRWRKGNGYVNNEYFFRAIQKYGWDGFAHDVLFVGLSKQQAEQKEIELIGRSETFRPERGYNIDLGGNGSHKFSAGTRLKISNALRGHPCSAETKEKIRRAKVGVPSGRKGKKLTPEQIEKNRAGHLGQKPWNLGRALSDEERGNLHKKPVMCIETGKVYKTAREASAETGVDHSDICKCRRGLHKTAGGYHWVPAE